MDNYKIKHTLTQLQNCPLKNSECFVEFSSCLVKNNFKHFVHVTLTVLKTVVHKHHLQPCVVLSIWHSALSAIYIKIVSYLHHKHYGYAHTQVCLRTLALSSVCSCAHTHTLMHYTRMGTLHTDTHYTRTHAPTLHYTHLSILILSRYSGIIFH